MAPWIRPPAGRQAAAPGSIASLTAWSYPRPGLPRHADAAPPQGARIGGTLRCHRAACWPPCWWRPGRHRGGSGRTCTSTTSTGAPAKVRPWITLGSGPSAAAPGSSPHDRSDRAAAGVGPSSRLVFSASTCSGGAPPTRVCLANTNSLDYVWCLLHRVCCDGAAPGGISLYRHTLPFFLGMILGDYVVPGLWG